MSVTAFGMALLLLAQAPSTDGRPAPPRPGLTWEDADQVARTLRRIDRRLRSGRRASKTTVVLTERQLNSFVNLSLAEQIPPELSELEFQLESGRLRARGRLDLDQLQAKMPEGGTASLLSMLSGVVPVELGSRVKSAEGLFQLELEEVTIGGLSLPPALLAQIIAFATKGEGQPNGVDIAAPVALPWTARQVRIEPGRALFDFY